MKKFLPIILILSVVLVSACTQYGGTTTTTRAPATTTTTVQLKPSVTVSDQLIVNSKVTIAKVVSVGPGWMTIHADSNGAPGAGIGQAAVSSGVNTNVAVEIDATKATSTLYAMLHVDKGIIGTYEFPGADVPATADGKPVSPSFKSSGTSATTTTVAAMTKTVVEITSTGFSPLTAKIKAGEKISFVNKDSSKTHWPASAVHPTHTIYPGSGITKCGTADASAIFDACKGLALNEEWTFTFTQKGSWNYHDHLNPSLTGTVVVE